MKPVIVYFWLLAAAFAPMAFADESVSTAAPEVTEDVTLDAVPAVVMEAARERMPDAYFQTASWTLEDDFKVYRIAGSFFRKEVAVYVREDGKYLWSESNNRDED